MKNSKLIRTILFNVLLILTLIIIFLLFFPKKSYVEKKLNEQLDPVEEEVFNSNINTMRVASIKYFEENDSDKVTLKELKEKNLITDLKDNNDNTCDDSSYSEQDDKKITIYLKCSGNEKKIEISKNEENKENKLLCLYEYRKEEEIVEWSDWSEWDKQEIKEDESTRVETKEEQEPGEKQVITESREISIDANTYYEEYCPEGYYESDGRCKARREMNEINASIRYSCPNGFRRNNLNCVKGSTTIYASREFYCPTNQSTIEYELTGEKCRTFKIMYAEKYKNSYYGCPEGYTLSNDKCYKTEYYENEIEQTNKVTYYRYQKKKTDKKIDVIWSTKDNKELLDQSYTMTREVTCDF